MDGLPEHLRILLFGPQFGNALSRANGLRGLGHDVEFVFEKDGGLTGPRLLRALEWRLCTGPATWRMNRRFVQRAARYHPHVLWVDMGKLVFPATLGRIRRRCGSLLINTMSDDFLHHRAGSRHLVRSIPLYDHLFTPRNVNFSELRELGARQVSKFWKGFDPDSLYPEPLSASELEVYGTDVAFIGHCEENRVQDLAALCRAVDRVKIWGPGWNQRRLPEVLRSKVTYREVWGDRYRKALCGAKIAVHFLSRWNRDTQSSRTFEVPACAVLMLAERSDDHRALYEEDREAVFFSGTEELVDKARFYASNDAPRRRIAEAGYRRCIGSGYSNHARAREMLEIALARRGDGPGSGDS
jgi:hypothetical protein